MINILLSYISCDEDTDEIGADRPYVIVAVVPLTPALPGVPVQVPIAWDVVVYPFHRMWAGSRPAFGDIGIFWGIGGVPATLLNPNDAIFVVAMNERDDGDPQIVRGAVEAAVGASLVRTGALPRPSKVPGLIADVDTARRIPTGAPNFDDTIGAPQELSFTADELRRADSGETITKTMVFSEDGGRYTLQFQARRSGPPPDTSWQFATSGLTREQAAMQLFQYIAIEASKKGYVGGFPTFISTTRDLTTVVTSVVLTSKAAEWRDVPLSDLGNVALDDFQGRLRASTAYAKKTGFVGGFPTFFHADYGKGIVCGTVLIKPIASELQDVPLSDLGNTTISDFDALFQATQSYALHNEFIGGFPTLFEIKKLVPDIRTGRTSSKVFSETVLLKPHILDIRTGRSFLGAKLLTL